MKYFIYCLKNYFKFSGRATRSEYWYFVLFGLLLSLAAMLIDFSIETYYIEERRQGKNEISNTSIK